MTHELTLANLGGGALNEYASMELRKICDSIADPNLKKAAKRTLTIKIEITPDEKGQLTSITYDIRSNLPGPELGKTFAYIAKAPGSDVLGLYEVETQPALPFEDESAPVIPLKRKDA